MTVYGTKCGVYEANLDEGTEVSSTYEGRHLTFPESVLAHPTPAEADGLVNKGMPVVVRTANGDIVGVALKSADANTDLIAIDTEGIWNLSVDAVNDWGDVLVSPGDPLYINDTDGTCTISRRQDPESNTLIGYALGSISSGDTAVIAVKVHWAPSENHILMGIINNYTEATSHRPRVRIDSDYSALTGTHNALDVRCGATAAGAASPIIRAIHGYAFTSGIKTNSAPWCLVTGVAGLVGLGGTVDANTLTACGIFGQVIPGAGTITKLSHLCAAWLDFAEPTEPGTSVGTEVLLLSNNCAQRLKQMVYMYGNSQASSGSADFIFRFDSLYFGGASGTPIRDGGTGNKTIKTGNDWKKIRISIEGVEYWLIACNDPTES